MRRVQTLWPQVALLSVLCAPVSLLAQGSITIDYPVDRSIFPPDMLPPTFLWRDPAAGSATWQVQIRFSDGSPALTLSSPGERMRLGPIDERCVATSNQPPKLTPEQAAAHTWTPDLATWETIKQKALERAATITITGLDAGRKEVSRGQMTLTVSKDPVGAPIFFRDVPLMPAEVEKGVIKPLPKSALPLVAWRLRYVGEPASRLMLDNLPTCANCHSFSRDGKTLGLDMDGPSNDKGLYALVNVQKNMSIRNEDVIAWSSFRGKLGAKIRVGFMSQVSPDGQYVVTMVNGSAFDGPPARARGGLPLDVQGNFYVQNFQDYRFLQVFYPTRGVLAWYSRESGRLQPLPGADDPRYVHTNATWSPDGQYLIFARAEAREAYDPATKVAAFANDPNETPVKYDLYRIPFNGGKGGKAEPVAGASANGMSNSFPKVSPDGRWLVYVQAKNGLLMRPDSQLHIVPLAGGKARKMTCNTTLMNSWHSFSPNGRWMVFSSKSRSPYTQMYLTHIDEQGNDSPPILIDNATAANRAVNLPEFVNVPQDGWMTLKAPATEFYRYADAGLESLNKGNYPEAIQELRKALTYDSKDTNALSNLGSALTELGEFEEAAAQFRQVVAIDPENAKAYANLGVALSRSGKTDEATSAFEKAVQAGPDEAQNYSVYGGHLIQLGRNEEAVVQLRKALELNPANADAHNNLGTVFARSGKFDEAIAEFQKALEAEPNSMTLHFNLGRAFGARGKYKEGVVHLEKAVEISGGRDALILDKLSGMYADMSRYREAIDTGKKALALAAAQNDEAMAQDLNSRIRLYEIKMPAQ